MGRGGHGRSPLWQHVVVSVECSSRATKNILQGGMPDVASVPRDGVWAPALTIKRLDIRTKSASFRFTLPASIFLHKYFVSSLCCTSTQTSVLSYKQQVCRNKICADKKAYTGP